MQIYKNNNWELSQIEETWFELEKHMQKLTEDNMENIFWLEFIIYWLLNYVGKTSFKEILLISRNIF